jgi:hypothetical protein
MFARNVSINLRPNTLSDFLKTMENEIVPLLRTQKGFQRRNDAIDPPAE